jgi:DinB superfamily
MASADELRQAITANRAKLREAIEVASGNWVLGEEEGDEANWGPRKVAEHAIGSEFFFAGMVAGVMLSKAPEGGEKALETAADALTALDATAEAVDKVIRYVEDRDLTKAAPMPDGIPFGKDIEGVLALTAYHLDDHAKQITNT